MDILSGAAMIILITVSAVFIYSSFQDIFSFFIAPTINGCLDERISILHRMGLHESANILQARFVYSWLDLLQ